jgi:hypothetical protein
MSDERSTRWAHLSTGYYSKGVVTSFSQDPWPCPPVAVWLGPTPVHFYCCYCSDTTRVLFAVRYCTP